MKRKTTILKKIKKKTSAFLNNDNPKKRKFKEYNGMLLLEDEDGLLLMEACKLDKKKKATEKRLKEIKEKLNLIEKGEYTNTAGDIVKITITPKKSEIDPQELYNIMTKKQIGKKFWGCVKVQITPLKKVVPETAIEKMQYELDPIVKSKYV